jgi:RNA polymerase sigma-70 factor (ECF subfamily)
MNIETLYESYSRDVFRFSLYLSGNWEDAEDITAETFVRAWVSEDSIRLATVKGYLFAIARNLFLQELRKKARHTEIDEEIADTRRGQDHYFEKREEYEAVLIRMQKLPEIDRAALLMRAFGQTPYEDIAQVLAISIASAKVKVHRARILLSAAQENTL